VERDRSGVSALVELDGFVTAQLLDEATASGGWRWRRSRIGPGASSVVSGRPGMATAES
jgi:hypothetical protein